jgi:hypothetical protein
MSQSQKTTTPTIVPNPEHEESKVVEKKSLVKRGVNYVKTHKKTTIAVAALAGLVGVSALAGRSTAPSNDLADPTLELEAPEAAEDLETETTVA